MTIPDTILKYWKNNGINPNNPALNKDILHLRELCGGMIPKNFENYLLFVNGMAPGETDKEMLTFWSIDQILKSEFLQHSHLSVIIPFADYCICSHIYCLEINPDQHKYTITVRDGINEKKIADSFADFIEKYCAKEESITNCFQ